jgi:hypothetical protein
MRITYLSIFACLFLFSCKKTEENPISTSKMNFTFVFDPTQTRLNNIGQPAPIPTGNAAQTPDFQRLSVHYIELAPTALTLLGKGAIVYKGPETTAGGDIAVDFEKAAISDQNTVFANINVADIAPGTYEWVRASVTYQQYQVLFNINDVPILGSLPQQKGVVSSFVGFNTYIKNLTPKTKTLTVNDDKKQGFWAFETDLVGNYAAYNNIYSGQAPAGATTVVNPLFASSPIPQGSCVVTGKFATPLVITGKETKDIALKLAFSTNNSFEWIDANGNGQLDFYADPNVGAEKIVDMGLRGLLPVWE